MLQQQLLGSTINVHRDGFSVVRNSDFVIFSVEAANMETVIRKFGPAMKVNSCACGQTSAKTKEIEAFEKFLPEDVDIISCHSLHGPSVNPKGQPLVIVNHRSSAKNLNMAKDLFKCFGSKIVYLSYKEHDSITADTQVSTHLAFLSMGTAWMTQKTFPWEDPQYLGGIENAKILMTLRIYGSKWHVYAGLALMNPFALKQVEQYAASVSDLFKLMIQEKETEFRSRIYAAKKFVFNVQFTDFSVKSQKRKREMPLGQNLKNPILLSDALLDDFSLSAIPLINRKPNSHLSLLSMVDCWYKLQIRPYDHLICQTPPFRLLLGITEYLFRDEQLLEDSINAALFDKGIRADDCEFYTAAKGWVECIALNNSEAYRQRFEMTSAFFRDRVPEAKSASDKMLESLAEKLE